MSRRLTALLFLALPLVAVAADDPKKDQPPDREKLLKATPEEFIKLFDKNNDGLLIADELPPPLARNFDMADRNGDGKLDAREIEGMLRAMRDRLGANPPPAGKPDLDKAVADLLDRLDGNKDGKVSKDEAKGPLGEVFARLDRNNDGFLDKDELKPAVERFGGAGTPPKPDLDKVIADIFVRLDSNKDSKISKDEAKGVPLGDNFARLDRNNDGFLDKDELKPFAERMTPPGGPGGRPGFPGGPTGPEFDPMDKDADGRLTREELKGTPWADKFDQIDANKDGKIDRKEFEGFTKKP